ncbi:hypothetical protein PAHAL_5G360600 [Panicum hallii]|uniref:Uncharacterized protein n=1 Tax=Panicum hallii TaxID=206008 RepID=A0A2T8IMB0_9POAL|nr:hypothetical protein PAHAL_5G360600 [Panicum hallii]
MKHDLFPPLYITSIQGPASHGALFQPPSSRSSLCSLNRGAAKHPHHLPRLIFFCLSIH